MKDKSGNSAPGRNRKTIMVIVIVAFLSIAGGYLYYSKNISSTQTTPELQIQTEAAQRGNITVSAGGTGTLVANTDATFGFETSGQVIQVNVKVGDQVEAGQVMAQLDYTLEQMKVVEAQQALNELYSAASIAAIEQEIGTAKDDKVAAREWLGYLLGPDVIDAEENLSAAEQKLAAFQDEAQAKPSDAANQAVTKQQKRVAYLKDKLTQAQQAYEDYYLPQNFTEYERQGRRQVVVTYTDPVTGKELPVIDRPSTVDVAKARNDYAQAIQTINDDETYLDVLKTGVIPEGATGKRLTTLYNAQQALRNAQSSLDATQLISPISGTVTLLDLNIGEQASTASIITISQLSQPYVVDAYLDEADWGNAKVGNKAIVTFDLLPDQTFPAILTVVYPGLVTSGNSSLVHIIVKLDQSISQNLPAGTGASISVVGGEANDVVLVPVNAIHKKDGGYVVTVIQNGQQLERKVKIGLQNETYVEIASGLNAGETVITE